MDWAGRNRRVRAHFHGVAAVAETTQWTGVERRWDTAATRRCSGPTTRLCTASIRPRQGMDVATGDPRGAARHGLTARCQHRWDYDEPYDVEVVDYH